MKRHRTDYFYVLPSDLKGYIFSFLGYTEIRKSVRISSVWSHDWSTKSGFGKRVDLHFMKELFLNEEKKKLYHYIRIQCCGSNYLLLHSHEMIRIQDFTLEPDFLLKAPYCKFWANSITKNNQIIWRQGIDGRSFLVKKILGSSPLTTKILLPSHLLHRMFLYTTNDNFFFWHESGATDIHFISLSDFFDAKFMDPKKLRMCTPFTGNLIFLELASSSLFLVAKCRLYPSDYFLVWNLKSFQMVNVVDIGRIAPRQHPDYVNNWKMNDSLLCCQLNSRTLAFSPLLSWKSPFHTKVFADKIESWGMNDTHLFISFHDSRIVKYQIRRV